MHLQVVEFTMPLAYMEELHKRHLELEEGSAEMRTEVELQRHLFVEGVQVKLGIH